MLLRERASECFKVGGDDILNVTAIYKVAEHPFANGIVVIKILLYDFIGTEKTFLGCEKGVD